MLRRQRTPRRRNKASSHRISLRRAELLQHGLVRLVAEPGPGWHVDQAIGIDGDAATPEARGPLHVKDFDEPFVPCRQQLQRRKKARTEIGRMRKDPDAELVGDRWRRSRLVAPPRI